MLQKVRLTVVGLLNDQNARVVLILGTLLIAALAGGAPHEFGGD